VGEASIVSDVQFEIQDANGVNVSIGAITAK